MNTIIRPEGQGLNLELITDSFPVSTWQYRIPSCAVSPSRQVTRDLFNSIEVQRLSFGLSQAV